VNPLPNGGLGEATLQIQRGSKAMRVKKG